VEKKELFKEAEEASSVGLHSVTREGKIKKGDSTKKSCKRGSRDQS